MISIDKDKENSQVYKVYNHLFDDIYFSIQDGLAEKRYVFIEGNDLLSRWNNLEIDEFTIVETGFGTGLAFFATWLELEKLGLSFKLKYISIEKYPLKSEQILEVMTLWPELSDKVKLFLEQYKLAKLEGKLEFRLGDYLTLTLLCGDIEDMLSYIDVPADSWFLDGFSPSKNPAMWSDNLYKFMAENTKASGSFATYTVASNVRRSLENVGFLVKKIQGYRNKREMLIGKLLEK